MTGMGDQRNELSYLRERVRKLEARHEEEDLEDAKTAFTVLFVLGLIALIALAGWLVS